MDEQTDELDTGVNGAPSWWLERAAAAIDLGVKTLDAQVPDWREHVEAETLRMSSCSMCVLGQLYGDYLVGLRELADEPNPHPGLGSDWGFATPDVSEDLGMLRTVYEAENLGWEPWLALTELWLERLDG